MNDWKPANPDFEKAIRDSFGRQNMMKTLGAQLESVTPGRVVIRLPYSSEICQQNDYIHAGAITSVVDSACGYAAASLGGIGTDILSVEFKVNMLAPATAPGILAIGLVVRAGRRLTVCQGEALSLQPGKKKVALMQATMIIV